MECIYSYTVSKSRVYIYTNGMSVIASMYLLYRQRKKYNITKYKLPPRPGSTVVQYPSLYFDLLWLQSLPKYNSAYNNPCKRTWLLRSV